MKLSFSTKGWQQLGWQRLYELARDVKLSGMEIHDPFDPIMSDRVLDTQNVPVSRRQLQEAGLQIACVDLPVDMADPDGDFLDKLDRTITAAVNMRTAHIRIHTRSASENGHVPEATMTLLSAALKKAEKANITLLLETAGMFSDTNLLKNTLDTYASDNLAALWDMHNTYFMAGETAQKTIENLGAYVRHVHIKDAIVDQTGDNHQYCLVGSGTLPAEDMMRALRSVNYDGFVSLEWNPDWLPDIDDPEIIFAHFVHVMSRFDPTARKRSTLFSNATGTGVFPWKKDTLLDMTFPQVLDRIVEEFPDQYAFRYTTLDYTRTYAEFRDDVDDFARVLVSMGVRAGQKVTVWLTNLPQWYVAFWATTKIGAVLVTMNTAYKIHEAEYLLRQSDTHTLVMIENYRDSDYKGIMQELCPELKATKPGQPLHAKRLPFLRNVITVGFRMEGCLTWEESLTRKNLVPIEEIQRMAAAVDKNDVCNMQYTSGTTGFPKGVMLTHYNVVNNGKYIGDHMDLSTADRMMIQVPMFHCFGMVLSMTASMTHGATMCPLPYFSPKSALACINQEKITTFNGVPTMFIAMMQHADFAKTDFSHIRTGIMAGANCPADLMRKATEVMNMKQIVSVYGQTEASPGCTMSSFTDPLDVRTDTVGSAFANVECKIVDPETGEECPVGVNGEFVARGYNIMKGYYKMPAATAAAIDADGWLHTGDLAAKDENGNYRITGRLKDMIIRGGENLYPKEIEEFFYTHPKVRDVQVIGVPDERYGEEAMACIILKEGVEATIEELRDYANAHMARHKVPRYLEFVSEFPMNAAGKILKYKMREQAIEKLGLKK
ncbi:MAG: AMP-dependent synthetase [Ruminococcaceae bacterium]|nr:AMP-dependent synthetase [Oscillospiraceae bacterium]